VQGAEVRLRVGQKSSSQVILGFQVNAEEDGLNFVEFTGARGTGCGTSCGRTTSRVEGVGCAGRPQAQMVVFNVRPKLGRWVGMRKAAQPSFSLDDVM